VLNTWVDLRVKESNTTGYVLFMNCGHLLHLESRAMAI